MSIVELILGSDVYGFDLANNGSLDGPKSYPIHGSNCSLDPRSSKGDNWWPQTHIETEVRPHRIPAGAWPSWWQASCSRLRIYYRPHQDYSQGAHYFVSHCHLLTWHYQIGWITLDNASNNDTFFVHLQRLLRQWNIKFNHIEQHIRFISSIFTIIWHCILIQLPFLLRCFPHVVNLACKAVLGVITQLQYAQQDAVDFIPDGEAPAPATFEEALKRDPVATTRSLIRGVSMYIAPVSLYYWLSIPDSGILSPPPILFWHPQDLKAERFAAAPRCWHTMVLNIAHGGTSTHFMQSKQYFLWFIYCTV